jgi:hypothetical protein
VLRQSFHDSGKIPELAFNVQQKEPVLGKDPNKIRSEHPTVVVMDEAAFIEQGAEAYDIAIASRVPKMLVVSSAAPGWFHSITRTAVPSSLDQYL